MPRARYDRIALLYDLLDLPFERGRYRQLRPHLWAGLEGRVLELGVGTGHNISFHPEDAEVIGIDISPAMLRRARRRAACAERPPALVVMDATALGFADASFDAAVASFVFCVLPEAAAARALAELARVVRPGGEIRLLDYRFSGAALRRLVMRAAAPWARLIYGAAFDRDPLRHFAAAGLEPRATRWLYEDIIRLLVATPKGRP